MKVAAILLAAALSACSATESGESDEPRYVNKEQGYSVATPEGWTQALVRGLAQFGSADPARKRHTIIVRSADKPHELTRGVAPTRDELIASTKAVLGGLPKAKVSAATPLEGAELPGARFSVTFIPQGRSVAYRREHAVLVGASHVYHVIYTAPQGEPIDEDAFKTAVSTLAEEG